MKNISIIITILLFFPSAYADDIFTTKYAKNVCESGSTSRSAAECSYKKYQVVEELLNKRYQELHKELNQLIDKYGSYSEKNHKKYSDLKEMHIISQRSWIKFRENECKALETWYRNGKLQKSLYYNCMRKIAEDRIEDFENFTKYQT